MSKTVTFVLKSLHCNDGIASYIEMLARGLRSRGWRTTLASGDVFAAGGAADRLNALQSLMDAWTVEPRLTRVGRPWEMPGQARILARIIQEHESSLLHLNGRALAPACWLQKLRTGVPCVNTMQTGLLLSEHSGLLNRRIMGRLMGDRYITISRETRDQALTQLGVPPDRLRLIHHGFGARFYPPAPQERDRARANFGLNASQFVCAVVARLGPIKRHDLVIKAMQRLRARGCDAVTLFAGEGYESHRAHLESMVAQCGLTPHTRFLGHVDPRPVLWASDVSILPSDLEGCPIVIPEAMACGLVPLRTQTEGALDQIEHGKNGFIFPRGDHDALAKHLEWLAGHPNERRAMGAAARETAQALFSAETMVAKTDAVYLELLASKPVIADVQAPEPVGVTRTS